VLHLLDDLAHAFSAPLAPVGFETWYSAAGAATVAYPIAALVRPQAPFCHSTAWIIAPKTAGLLHMLTTSLVQLRSFEPEAEMQLSVFWRLWCCIGGARYGARDLGPIVCSCRWRQFA